MGFRVCATFLADFWAAAKTGAKTRRRKPVAPAPARARENRVLSGPPHETGLPIFANFHVFEDIAHLSVSWGNSRSEYILAEDRHLRVFGQPEHVVKLFKIDSKAVKGILCDIDM